MPNKPLATAPRVSDTTLKVRFMAKNDSTQLTLPQERFDALTALAREESKSVEDLLFDLILVYRSERLKRPERAKALQLALEECWRVSRQNGTDTMTMEEIDAEIAEARSDARRLAQSA